MVSKYCYCEHDTIDWRHDELLVIHYRIIKYGSSIIEEVEEKLDVHKFVITNSLRQNCKSANMRYKAYLEDMKKEKILSETEKRKRDLKDEIAASNGKKIKLDREIGICRKV